ncbi:DNA/RNA non-specific endonuclease, partial [Aquabacterium sp. UBA2148]|uniref:DNA/RNA non-specific endonuclease n=1 Tax=Aquabacterium sp. UBA2148 TaxID=1946042 RepID=UPI00257DD3D5
RSGGLAGGSDVGTTNNHFDDLNIRRHGDATSTSTASYYVLGHLLNQELGGPGTQWGNLTPLSRSGNGLHETRVESQVKGKVAEGKVIRYEVRVVYGRSASPLLAQTPASSTNPVIINKRKILLKEQHVASALDCRAVEWDLGSNQAKAGGWSMTPTAVPNPVESTSLSDYNVPGQAALRLQTLAINDSIRALGDPARAAEHAMHTAALQSLPGIGPARFDALKARSYRTWEDFWSTVPGVTQDTTNAWRAGLPGGARVVLNGTTTWI